METKAPTFQLLMLLARHDDLYIRKLKFKKIGDLVEFVRRYRKKPDYEFVISKKTHTRLQEEYDSDLSFIGVAFIKIK